MSSSDCSALFQYVNSHIVTKVSLSRVEVGFLNFVWHCFDWISHRF